MKQLIVFVLLFSATLELSAQKIKVNEVDKFSNIEKIETSVETLFKQIKAVEYFKFDFNIRRYNGIYSMAANIYLGTIENYDENSGIIFLLDNGALQPSEQATGTRNRNRRLPAS